MPPQDLPASLPPEVAAEIAAYLRSALFAPLYTNIAQFRTDSERSLAQQKDLVQDAQAEISSVIEPAAEALLPIAEELVDVYEQIELLETLVDRTDETIRTMTAKVERTEAAVRRETRALDEGKPVPLWQEQHAKRSASPSSPPFRARDYVESGRLKKRAQGQH